MSSLTSEAEACTRKDSFGVLETFNLICACFLAQVEVLHDEVACSMQLLDDGVHVLQVCGGGSPGLLCRHERVLDLCLGARLASEGCGIARTCRLRVGHEISVV